MLLLTSPQRPLYSCKDLLRSVGLQQYLVDDTCTLPVTFKNGYSLESRGKKVRRLFKRLRHYIADKNKLKSLKKNYKI